MVWLSALRRHAARHCLRCQSSIGWLRSGWSDYHDRASHELCFDGMERCVVHSNTFGQNDMAMAAALATFHVLEEDEVISNAAELGQYAIDRLTEIAKSCPFVSEVRGEGLMFGIDFKRPDDSLKLKAVWDTLHRMNFGVFSQMIVLPLMHEHRSWRRWLGITPTLLSFCHL